MKKRFHHIFQKIGLNRILINFVSMLALLFLLWSCDNNAWKAEMDELRAELSAQRTLLEALSKNDLIVRIEESTEGYTLYLQSGKTLTLSNGKTTTVTIGENGHWFIDGSDSGVEAAGEEGHSPRVEIGIDGHWYVDGTDTGITAKGENGQDAPRVSLIVFGTDFCLFCFSDGTEISVDRIGLSSSHKGKNLMDPTKVEVSNPVFGFVRSDYIPIREGETMTASSNHTMWQTTVLFYDKYGKEIPEARYEEENMDVQQITVTAPAGAAFVRFEFREPEGLNQVERGNKRTDYERYVSDYESLKSLVLPDTLLLLSGKEYALYTDNIISKSSFEYAGLAADRFPIYTDRIVVSSSQEGIVAFPFRIFQRNLIDQAGTRFFRFLNPENVLKKEVSILFVGDSFTDIGSYIEFTGQALQEYGVDLHLVGTHNLNPLRKSESLSGGMLSNFVCSPAGKGAMVRVLKGEIPQSTYGSPEYVDANGVSWQVTGNFADKAGNIFLRLGIWDRWSVPEASIPADGTLRKKDIPEDAAAQIEYDQGQDCRFNPFWNPQTDCLDFNYYLSSTCQETPDIIVIQFTWNDLPPFATDKECLRFAEEMRQCISSLHHQLPDTRVLISIEPAGALLSRRGADYIDGHHYTRLSCFRTLSEAFAEDALVSIVPSFAFVDRLHGFNAEEYAADDIHCNDSGMRQISDALVPYIVTCL